jgi:hypothetical protein
MSANAVSKIGVDKLHQMNEGNVTFNSPSAQVTTGQQVQHFSKGGSVNYGTSSGTLSFAKGGSVFHSLSHVAQREPSTKVSAQPNEPFLSQFLHFAKGGYVTNNEISTFTAHFASGGDVSVHSATAIDRVHMAAGGHVVSTGNSANYYKPVLFAEGGYVHFAEGGGANFGGSVKPQGIFANVMIPPAKGTQPGTSISTTSNKSDSHAVTNNRFQFHQTINGADKATEEVGEEMWDYFKSKLMRSGYKV